MYVYSRRRRRKIERSERGRKMGIRFILMVNKQGQTRLAQYYEWLTLEERRALEGEIVRKCLARNDQQVNLFLFQCDPSNSIVIFGSDLVSISQ